MYTLTVFNLQRIKVIILDCGTAARINNQSQRQRVALSVQTF